MITKREIIETVILKALANHSKQTSTELRKVLPTGNNDPSNLRHALNNLICTGQILQVANTSLLTKKTYYLYYINPNPTNVVLCKRPSFKGKGIILRAKILALFKVNASLTVSELQRLLDVNVNINWLSECLKRLLEEDGALTRTKLPCHYNQYTYYLSDLSDLENNIRNHFKTYKSLLYYPTTTIKGLNIQKILTKLLNAGVISIVSNKDKELMFLNYSTKSPVYLYRATAL